MIARASFRRTSAVGALALVLLAASPGAAGGRRIASVLAEAERHALYPTRLPTPPVLETACGGDAVCAGRRIAAAHGDGARVVRVESPSSDSIRRQIHLPSLRVEGRTIRLDRFGRRVVDELAAALATLGGAPVVLDLRGNGGGRLDRMTRVAGRLLGNVARAFRARDATGGGWRDLKASGPAPRVATVLIGPETASSAEILAALLRRWGGSRLIGARTAGKDVVSRVIALDQANRLLLPSARIEVPGERLAGGLAPGGRAGFAPRTRANR